MSKPIQEFQTVGTWLQGLREQWGQEPDDWEERLRALSGFVDFAGRDPDAIIRECVRESDSGKRISSKARRYYDERIAEWQRSLPGDRWAQARAGNAVRSFLIHNGIFLQSGLQM